MGEVRGVASYLFWRRASDNTLTLLSPRSWSSRLSSSMSGLFASILEATRWKRLGLFPITSAAQPPTQSPGLPLAVKQIYSYWEVFNLNKHAAIEHRSFSDGDVTRVSCCVIKMASESDAGKPPEVQEAQETKEVKPRRGIPVATFLVWQVRDPAESRATCHLWVCRWLCRKILQRIWRNQLTSR